MKPRQNVDPVPDSVADCECANWTYVKEFGPWETDDHHPNCPSNPSCNRSKVNIKAIRSEIDEAIDKLWAEAMCMDKVSDPSWVGHGIIEGLKRARLITGEEWNPDRHDSEGWKRYCIYIDPPGQWVMKERWVCSKEQPYDPNNKEHKLKRWEHPEAFEVGEQQDGYPGGDIVTYRCPICNIKFKTELPQ